MAWTDTRMSPPSRTCCVAVSLLTILSNNIVAGLLRRAARPAAASSVASRESVLEYFLLEELYPRAFVGNIVTEYGLDRRYPPSVVKQLRFRFLAQSTPAGMRFSLFKLCPTKTIYALLCGI